MRPRTQQPHRLTTACPSDAADFASLLRFSHALRGDGRLVEAVACHARVTALHPRRADGWFDLGLAQQAHGDLGAAARALGAGLRLRPADAGRLTAYGVVLQQAERLDEARDAYRRSIARSPGAADAHFNLGTAHEAAGDFDAALAAYRAALDRDYDEARVHNNIGGVLSAQGDVDGSIAAYREAVDADAAFADGWYNWGNVLLAAGRLGEADAHLRRALKIEPRHPRAGRKLAHVRAEATRPRQHAFEAEAQLAAARAAAELCADDDECARREVEADDAARDADGPLIV